jgi:hypothetical protein
MVGQMLFDDKKEEEDSLHTSNKTECRCAILEGSLQAHGYKDSAYA